MRLEKDFVEFLGLFNKHKVKYCVIGAFAVGLYGYPRYTKDIDILVEPSPENAGRIIKAIREFGLNSPELTEKYFGRKNKIVQLGYEPVRIDLLTSIKGIGFGRIWRNKITADFGGQKVFFIHRKDLIASKRRAARPQDKIDLEKILARNK